MREIKSELVSAERRYKLAVLRNIPHHHGLVKANRFLFMLVFVLMALVFVLGFFLIPSADGLEKFNQSASPIYKVENPVLTAEINMLKGQFVGLISGSIESKLRTLEESIRIGSLNSSLGTIQDLRNDLTILRSYSTPVKAEVKKADNQVNEALLQEVSQLKTLIYLTLTSCGLMIAAVAGFWVRNLYRLNDRSAVKRSMLGRHK